jgi:hypothetical protein
MRQGRFSVNSSPVSLLSSVLFSLGWSQRVSAPSLLSPICRADDNLAKQHASTHPRRAIETVQQILVDACVYGVPEGFFNLALVHSSWAPYINLLLHIAITGSYPRPSLLRHLQTPVLPFQRHPCPHVLLHRGDDPPPRFPSFPPSQPRPNRRLHQLGRRRRSACRSSQGLQRFRERRRGVGGEGAEQAQPPVLKPRILSASHASSPACAGRSSTSPSSMPACSVPPSTSHPPSPSTCLGLPPTETTSPTYRGSRRPSKRWHS